MSISEMNDTDAEQMDEQEVEQFLREQGVGVLAVSDRDLPYVIPISFGYDGGSCLYFIYLLFGEESKKESLSERVEMARFLVYSAQSMYEWRSVILTGKLKEVQKEGWDELQTAMKNAWHPNLFSTATPTRGIKGYQFRITDETSLKHSEKSNGG